MKKNELVKYAADPRASALIKAGKFEPAKYELVTGRKWSVEFAEMFPASITEAINLKTPSLSTYKKYKGEKDCYLLISAMVLQMAAAFNVGKKLTKAQLYITARHLYQKYYFLTLADFRLCFNNAIAGDYGPLFDRLDTNTILEWLRQYNAQRLEIAAFNSHNQHIEEKNAKADDPDPDGLRKLAELGAALEKKARAEKEGVKEGGELPHYCGANSGNLPITVAIEAKARQAWEGDNPPDFSDFVTYYNSLKLRTVDLLAEGKDFKTIIKTLF